MNTPEKHAWPRVDYLREVTIPGIGTIIGAKSLDGKWCLGDYQGEILVFGATPEDAVEAYIAAHHAAYNAPKRADGES